MRRVICVLGLLAAFLGTANANAAVAEASFTQQSGSSWTVDLTITNDGLPAAITGFTVYFSETLFAGLSVVTSPAEWDSIAVEPDVALASAGFLDSFLIDPTVPLSVGQTQGGFRLAFTFLGVGTPPMLPFDIVDQSYNVLFSGVTAPPVLEPSTAVLTGLGLLGLLAFRGRLARRSQT